MSWSFVCTLWTNVVPMKIFLDIVLLSDERSFFNNELVNRHNFKFYSNENLIIFAQ